MDYKKTNDKTNISASAQTTSGNIKQIEITKSGEVIARNNGDTIPDTEIEKSGWYQIKAETTKGKLRYAWVRINSINQSFQTPIITVSEGERGANDWYRQNLKIKITGTDENASKIHYMLNNAKQDAGSEEGAWQTAEGPETEITIDTEGRTTIIAYVSDGTDKNTSEHISYTAKYDSKPPTINEPQITGTGDTKNDWHTSDVTVQISGGDTESGINRILVLSKRKYNWNIPIRHE